MSSEEKSRFSRWAERKAAARQRRGSAAPAIAEAPDAVPVPAAPPVEDAETGPEEAGPPAPECDLPDIDSLGAGSDFTAFMKDGVPAALRRLALRKLWASDPAFNVIDEMVEYGEDYTNAATVVEGMKSAWEAGRGYAKKRDGEERGAQPVSGDPKEEGPVAEDQVGSDEPPPGDDDEEAE